jgi:hypothetical protein
MTTKTGKKRKVGGANARYKHRKKKLKNENDKQPLQGLCWTIGNKLQQMEGLEIGTTKSDICLGKWGLGNTGKLYVTGQAAGLVSTATGSGKSRTRIECYGQSFFAREKENCFAWNRFIPRAYLGQRGQKK